MNFFLEQTNEEFIKLQMRSLLTNPHNKKLLKRKLKQVGLYNAKIGFSTYKDFIITELNQRRSKSTNSKYKVPDFTTPRKRDVLILPKIPPKAEKKPGGFLETSFFSKNKNSTACCVLFKLTQKINIIPGIDPDFKPIRFSSKDSTEFLSFYLGFFLTISRNLNFIKNEIEISLPPDIEKLVSSTYLEIGRFGTSGTKKYKSQTKDMRFQGFLETKPWSGMVAEGLHRFYYKKFSVLSERNFQSFISNYLLTNILTNMQRMCFEIYDRGNAQCIKSSDLFAYFESPIFPLISSDLFVMINFLSNYKYTSDKLKLKRRPTLYLQEVNESQNKKITFNVFVKLRFEQKFPDLLLVLVYLIYGDAALRFICAYYNIRLFKISTIPSLSLSRPMNYCQNFYRTVCEQYKFFKYELLSLTNKYSHFTKDLVKGALISFFLICESDSLCELKVLGASPSSMAKGSDIFLGKKCREVMKRLYNHIFISIANASVREYVEFFQGFFSEEEMQLKCFLIYDVNSDGYISVVELIGLIDSAEASISKEFDEEVKKLTELMEQKRIVTEFGAGFMDIVSYTNLVPQPAFAKILSERLNYLAGNRKKVFKEMHDRLNAEYNSL